MAWVAYTMDDGVTTLEAATGKILWQRELYCFACSVTVGGPRVYIGARDVSGENPGPGRLYALDITTGGTIWSTTIAGTPAWTPAGSANRAYLGTHTEVRGV